MTDIAFQARGVSKVYPGVTALDHVDLTMRAGEIHALLGENGAGKSSLIKMLAGVHRPDGGSLWLDGNEVHFATPSDSMRAGIGVVHQERNLVPRYSIAENLFLDRIPLRRGLVDRAQMRDRARRWLDRLELDLDPDTPVQQLSVAQMQMIEIGRALSLRSKILVLDEPTASITGHEAELLFDRMRRLRDEGVAILFVSHKLEEVLSVCDRYTVLRDGKLACADLPIAEATRDDLVRHMVGRDGTLATLPDRSTAPGATHLTDPTSTVTDRQLSGLKTVESRPVVRSIQRGGGYHAARGIEVKLSFDERAFEGSGILLLGAVLDRFLAEYASVNSFTQVVVSSTQRGAVKTWPPRTGQGPLL